MPGPFCSYEMSLGANNHQTNRRSGVPIRRYSARPKRRRSNSLDFRFSARLKQYREPHQARNAAKSDHPKSQSR